MADTTSAADLATAIAHSADDNAPTGSCAAWSPAGFYVLTPVSGRWHKAACTFANSCVRAGGTQTMGKLKLEGPAHGTTLADCDAPATQHFQPRDSLLVTRARLGLDSHSSSSGPHFAGGPDAYVDPVRAAPPAAPCASNRGPPHGARQAPARRVVPHHVTLALQSPLPQAIEGRDSFEPSRRWTHILRRMLGCAPLHLSADRQAAAVHQWLKIKELYESSQSKPRQKLRAFYGEDVATSTMLSTASSDIKLSLAWLDQKGVRALREMLIDRARAEACAPALVQPILLDALRGFFQEQMTPQRMRKPVLQTVRSADAACEVGLLRSMHIGTVRFDCAMPQQATPRGAWFVGVGATGIPLAVKKLKKPKDKSEQTTTIDAIRRGDYLVRHETDTHVYFVVPLYGATLQSAAASLLVAHPQAKSQVSVPSREHARGVFALIIKAVHKYHQARRRPHAGICAEAFFLDTEHRQFILSRAQSHCDAGLQEDSTAAGDVAAEQMAGIAASRLSDTFDACQMFVLLWLTYDPALRITWQRLHPKSPLPLDLLAGNALGFAQKVFRVWSEAAFGERQSAVTLSAGLSHIPAETKRNCVARFEAIDTIMHIVDPSLWKMLCRGLQGRLIRDEDIALEFTESAPKAPALTKATQSPRSDSWGTIASLAPKMRSRIARLRQHRLDEPH